jgi:hypothetical protein
MGINRKELNHALNVIFVEYCTVLLERKTDKTNKVERRKDMITVMGNLEWIESVQVWGIKSIQEMNDKASGTDKTTSRNS